MQKNDVMKNVHEPDFLGACTPHDISIQDWLLETKKNFPSECSYLLEHSNEYREVLSGYPAGFPEPKVCEKDHCHKNTMLYLIQLRESHPILAQELQYVTGFMKASSFVRVIHPALLHLMVRHSFLLYKGSVLDITLLKYPPLYYVVNQYVGVAFHSDLMGVSWDFDKKRGFALGVIDFVMQKGTPFMVT